jgi:hypothetical protein
MRLKLKAKAQYHPAGFTNIPARQLRLSLSLLIVHGLTHFHERSIVIAAIKV